MKFSSTNLIAVALAAIAGSTSAAPGPPPAHASAVNNNLSHSEGHKEVSGLFGQSKEALDSAMREAFITSKSKTRYQSTQYWGTVHKRLKKEADTHGFHNGEHDAAQLEDKGLHALLPDHKKKALKGYAHAKRKEKQAIADRIPKSSKQTQ